MPSIHRRGLERSGSRVGGPNQIGVHGIAPVVTPSKLVRLGAGTAAVSALLMSLLAPAEAAAAPPVIGVQVTRHFSPNGDGVKDQAVLRYTLPRTGSEVTWRISGPTGLVRQGKVGEQAAGEYTVTWAGRLRNGEPAPDGNYSFAVSARFSTASTKTTKHFRLDTTFMGRVMTERYGAPASRPNRVFPRSTEVVDALPLTAETESSLASGSLVIKDEAGRAVLRRDVKDGDLSGGTWRRSVRWTARQHGEALPVGRYRAFVKGVDKAGNKGRSAALEVRVSPQKLVWREESRVLAAAQTDVSGAACGWISTGNDCPFSFYCGDVVASELFVGGRSHRSAVCPSGSSSLALPEATSWHLVSSPDAVHGIDSARVAFNGQPTNAGETDQGTLHFGGTTTTSAGSGQSPWVQGSPLSDGRVADEERGIDRIPPSAFWTFSTTGEDSFDVATFTVDLRYLVVDR